MRVVDLWPMKLPLDSTWIGRPVFFETHALE